MMLDGKPCGNSDPIILIAGPCVIESQQLVDEIAGKLVELTSKARMGFVFKASFDKANRSSRASFRGRGIDAGLKILERVRKSFGVPVLTDVHEVWQVADVVSAVDVLQIPAMLCRQTDLILAAADTGKPVNIKKGQFVAPRNMSHAVDKVLSAGNPNVMLTERGTCFGYNNLVVDMRSLEIMKGLGVPVIFDATHSVQLPGAGMGCSGGEREFVPVLAKAAVAVGVAGVFIETHPRPDEALSDGPNAWPLDRMGELIEQLQAIDRVAKA